MTVRRTRPQVESKRSNGGPVRGLDLARRFEVIAAPGRRALQSHMNTIRPILIVLAVITLLIVAYAQWLAFQPNPYPAATLAALNRERYKDTFATATATPSPSPLPSASPVPSGTPTPKPTNTRVPLPTGRPRAKPTATEPALASALPAGPLPAPRLVAPGAGVTAFEIMIFQWAWEGPPLTDTQAFDLRIWSVQEEQAGSPRRGVAPPTRETQLQVSLAAVPAVLDYGPGDYLWTVVLVEVRPDGSPVVIGAWGESRKLVYR